MSFASNFAAKFHFSVHVQPESSIYLGDDFFLAFFLKTVSGTYERDERFSGLYGGKIQEKLFFLTVRKYTMKK